MLVCGSEISVNFSELYTLWVFQMQEKSVTVTGHFKNNGTEFSERLCGGCKRPHVDIMWGYRDNCIR